MLCCVVLCYAILYHINYSWLYRMLQDPSAPPRPELRDIAEVLAGSLRRSTFMQSLIYVINLIHNLFVCVHIYTYIYIYI